MRIDRLAGQRPPQRSASSSEKARAIAEARNRFDHSLDPVQLKAARRALLIVRDHQSIDAYSQRIIDTAKISFFSQRERSTGGEIEDFKGRKIGFTLGREAELAGNEIRAIFATAVKLCAYAPDPDLIWRLNFLLPNSQLQGLSQSDGEIELGLLNPDLLSHSSHEIGHLIFEASIGIHNYGYKKGTLSKDPFWNCLYLFSLGERRHALIKDSNFIDDEKCGHPEDNTSEFFASSVRAYFSHAERLAETIAATPKNNRLLGRLIWLYLRDRTFNGRTFGPDPFKNRKFEQEFGLLPITEVVASWQAARTVMVGLGNRTLVENDLFIADLKRRV